MIDKDNITGIILAGGKSSRMGTDKGFLKSDGKHFVEHSIAAISPLVSQIMIVSNNPAYDSFKVERVNDIIQNSGPLAGIHSGLNHSKTDYNLVLSCDIPFIKTSILEMLINAQDGSYDIVQIVSQGKQMPLIALYKKQCEAVFFEILQNDERRLHIALNQCKVKNVELISEDNIFTKNINTPEELNEIQYADKN